MLFAGFDDGLCDKRVEMRVFARGVGESGTDDGKSSFGTKSAPGE